MMFRLFAGLAALFALCLVAAPITDAHATEPHAGYGPRYAPYAYRVHDHYHYHRHDHCHHYGYPYGPAPGWYYPYRPPYAVEYGYRVYPRVHKRKRVARPGKKLDPNWYYCKSYWRDPARMTAARTWWPYYEPRPATLPLTCRK